MIKLHAKEKDKMGKRIECSKFYLMRVTFCFENYPLLCGYGIMLIFPCSQYIFPLQIENQYYLKHSARSKRLDGSRWNAFYALDIMCNAVCVCVFVCDGEIAHKMKYALCRKRECVCVCVYLCVVPIVPPSHRLCEVLTNLI